MCSDGGMYCGGGEWGWWMSGGFVEVSWRFRGGLVEGVATLEFFSF